MGTVFVSKKVHATRYNVVRDADGFRDKVFDLGLKLVKAFFLSTDEVM